MRRIRPGCSSTKTPLGVASYDFHELILNEFEYFLEIDLEIAVATLYRHWSCSMSWYLLSLFRIMYAQLLKE